MGRNVPSTSRRRRRARLRGDLGTVYVLERIRQKELVSVGVGLAATSRATARRCAPPHLRVGGVPLRALLERTLWMPHHIRADRHRNDCQWQRCTRTGRAEAPDGLCGYSADPQSGQRNPSMGRSSGGPRAAPVISATPPCRDGDRAGRTERCIRPPSRPPPCARCALLAGPGENRWSPNVPTTRLLIADAAASGTTRLAA